MSKPILNSDSEFLVGEEKVLNYILAFLFFALFMYGLTDAVRRQFKNLDYQSFVFALALAPAYIFLQKGRSRRVFIRINKQGIYQDEKLVTGWANLLKAYLSQDHKKLINIKDNFVLVVEYKSDKDPKQGLRRKIPLTNTQNKSEEEVLYAVNFFWNGYKKKTAAPH